MSPKEYFELLFKCFFKINSLEKEIENWDKYRVAITVIWANLYNAVLAYLFICFVWFGCIVFHIPFDIKQAATGIFAAVIFILFIFICAEILNYIISRLFKNDTFLGSIVNPLFVLFDNIILHVVNGILACIILGTLYGFFNGSLHNANLSIAGDISFSIFFGIMTGIILILSYDNGNPIFPLSGFNSFISLGILIMFTILKIRFDYLGVQKNIDEYIFNNGVILTFLFIFTYSLLCGKFWYLFYLPIYKKKNPLWWDENIIIPVPFLTRMLRSYAKKNDFDKTIEFAKFLIEERPVQRKAAQNGLILIALDRMRDFDTIGEIEKLTTILSFMPPSNTNYIKSVFYETKSISSISIGKKGYNIVSNNKENIRIIETEIDIYNYYNQLELFITISEDINKTWNELNRSNRISIYERAQQQLLDYRKSSNLSKYNFAKEFGEVADAWQKILTKTINDLRANGKLPLPNPYTLGKAIQADSEMFLGRRDIIQKIETETLREGAATALLFIGNRRTGKSSTLNNLQRFVQSALRTVFADLQDAEVNNSTANFCETLTERIAKSLRIKQPEPIRDLAAFTKWLKQLDAQLIRENRYLLICLDEYERLEGLIQRGKLTELPDSLRHWIQHLQHVVFLLAGSHEPAELDGIDWTDYLINVRNVPISYLEYDAALQLVTAPVPHFDLTWETPDLPDKLVQRLGRQPFLLQCAMWNLVEMLNNQGTKHATQADIERALDKVMDGDASNHFSHFWKTEMTDAARSILSNLARGTQPTEGAVLNLLKRKEIVANVDGQYVFCVPLLREWILRNVD